MSVRTYAQAVVGGPANAVATPMLVWQAGGIGPLAAAAVSGSTAAAQDVEEAGDGQ